jgi:hypothetical protein
MASPKYIKEPKLFKNKKLEFYIVPTEKVELYKEELKKLLKLFESEDALITDESLVWDFFFIEDEEEELILNKISKELGFPILRGDYLVEVAAKMRK